MKVRRLAFTFGDWLVRWALQSSVGVQGSDEKGDRSYVSWYAKPFAKGERPFLVLEVDALQVGRPVVVTLSQAQALALCEGGKKIVESQCRDLELAGPIDFDTRSIRYAWRGEP